MELTKRLVKKDYLSIACFVEYDPTNGSITNKLRIDAKERLDKDGYKVIKVKGELWRSNIIAWVKTHGKIPSGVIDHINHNRADNRISNLRDISQADNNRSRTKKINKDTNEVGIYLDKSTKGLLSKYTTRIRGKIYRFRNLIDAINFRKEHYGNI